MAKIKVSQKTIDNIKAMGMTAALKKASGASPEMKEALTRMYGAKRVSAAGGSSKPVAKSADAARSSVKKPVYKSADAARASVSKVSTAKAPVKKSGTTDPFAKFVFGIGSKLNADNRMTAAQVAAENKRRASGVTPPKKADTKVNASSVAATNAKRMGISVAEYNKRLAAAKKNK